MTLAFLMEVIMKKLVLLLVPLLITSSSPIFAANINNSDFGSYEAPAALHRVVNPRAYIPKPTLSKDAPLYKQKVLVMRAANLLCLGSLALLAVEMPSILENYSRKTAENILMISLSSVFLMHAVAKKICERM